MFISEICEIFYQEIMGTMTVHNEEKNESIAWMSLWLMALFPTLMGMMSTGILCWCFLLEMTCMSSCPPSSKMPLFGQVFSVHSYCVEFSQPSLELRASQWLSNLGLVRIPSAALLLDHDEPYISVSGPRKELPPPQHHLRAPVLTILVQVGKIDMAELYLGQQEALAMYLVTD